jgi:hypothetical protein
MESIKRDFRNRMAKDPQVKSVVAVQDSTRFSPLIDGLDILILIVTESATLFPSVIHYIKEDKRIQERRIDAPSLERAISEGRDKGLVPWILQGEILVDRNLYMETLRHKLLEFPEEMREQKLLIEFNLFLKSYMQSKHYIQDDLILDAYSCILKALHHWARIAIVEAGYQPEITVWAHVRKINSGIYKLYEELTSSSETLEQRVRLVLLASEFSVMSKMEKCCSLLLRILGTRQEGWSPEELRMHPELVEMGVEPGLLLTKMAAKSLVREVVSSMDPELSTLELRYTSAKESA